MLRFARALTLPLAFLLAAAPALAADNWTVKDSTGATVTLRSKDTGAGQAQYHIMADGNGAAYSATNPLAALLNAGTAHIGSFNLDQVGGTAVSLGQKASAASIPVVLPSDGTQATAANQATANSSLASIDTKATANNTSLATIATNTAGLATAAGQTTLNTANGTPADPAYTGSNTATQIALLKAIYGQAAPTSVPGTSIGSTTQVPGFQGVTGGVPVGVNLLVGGAAPSLAAPLAVQNSIAGAAVSAANPYPVDTIVKGGGTDVGGTITTASTAQTFMAANPSRRAWSLQNQSTGDLYVNCSATATLDYHSLKIPAGALYESPTTHVGTGACSIIGATAGQAFYARQF